MEALSRPPHLAYRLEEWIEANKRFGRSRKWLADQVGVTEQALSRYCKKPGTRGHRIPEQRVMERIYVVTGGMVQPNSFYALPDLSGTAISLTPPLTKGEAA